uniref:Uncharacterized protein LOC114348222 n=1 Tax=Diabrotica virgifera virgifera TaxID=50390 RepID=A0A6P7GY00_DIAVI
LRKRRALSVQEFFHNPNQEKPNPTFYVPSPCPNPVNAQTRRPRSRQRAVNSLSFTPTQSREYIKCNSGEWHPLPYEPPPDYDLEEKPPNRRWSVVTFSKESHKPKPKIENVNIKIPKTKLNKQYDRARSQSPSWKKEQFKVYNGENRRVANSKSHYELIGARDKPERGRDRGSEHQEKPNPTFYVPSPCPNPVNAQTRRPRSRQRAVNSLSFTPTQSREYIKCNSGEWHPLPYEPPPDYDLEEKPPNRRWSVVTFSKESHKPKPKIENVNIKIPKTKLNKQYDRARSQSPSWKKEQFKVYNGENRRVANSKSHYELIGARDKPERGRDRGSEHQ